MLRNLVKKFKSHSLNDDADDAELADNQIFTRPRNVKKSITTVSSATSGQNHQCDKHEGGGCPHHCRQNHGSKQSQNFVSNSNDGCDSGTESDEELEQIDSNSTRSVPISRTSDFGASQQSLSINSCRSSSVCESPGLSDQESNSWESIGSESGINLRAQKVQPHYQNYLRRDSMKMPSLTSSFNTNCNFVGVNETTNQFDKMFLKNSGNFNESNVSSLSTTPTPILIKEELPNHPYHTRQQFQRLKQQISSMQDGQIDIDDSSLTFQQSQDQLHHDTSTIVKNPTDTVIPIFRNTKIIDTQSTAFSPFSRISNQFDQFGKSQRIAATSAFVQTTISSDRNQHNTETNPRRWRSSTLSTISAMSSSGVSTWSSCSSSSSGSISEKRKWSQTKNQPQHQQQQKLKKSAESCCCCLCVECSIEKRPVLQAARKTPVKLIFQLSDDASATKNDVTSITSTTQVTGNEKSFDAISISDQPTTTRKTRFSTRKKCRGGDYETKSMETDDDDEEIRRNTVQNAIVKRPSLDFEKMRAKRVSKSTCGRRSKSFHGSSVKSNMKGYRRNGYHLRSTQRQCYVFRPLDPPTPASSTSPTSSVTDGRITSGFPVFGAGSSK